MRNLIKKYFIEGDAVTAWLLLKAPFLAALIYFVLALKGDREAVISTLFFFPYVFLLLKNLWLEILHQELLQKLKSALPALSQDSGLETELITRLFKITRWAIVIMAASEVFLAPLVMNINAAPRFSDIPAMAAVSLVLVFTLAVFLLQVRFSFHLGKLLHVLETKRKYDPRKEINSNHRIKTLNPVSFRKAHERIKNVLKKA